jgi:hypothetical protein
LLAASDICFSASALFSTPKLVNTVSLNLVVSVGFLGPLGCSVTSTVASSATTPLASVTSSVNSSPKTLLDASIALAGKNLFI